MSKKWRFEESTMTIRSIPENYWIASMNSWDGAVDNKANGALIATAPELLAALELVTMELKQMHLHYQPDCEGGCPSAVYIIQAEKAIKRAKGERT